MNTKQKVFALLQDKQAVGATTQELLDATGEPLPGVAYVLGRLVSDALVKPQPRPFTMENLGLRWFVLLVCATLLCSCTLLEDFDRFHTTEDATSVDAGTDAAGPAEVDAAAELDASTPELDAGTDAADLEDLDAAAEASTPELDAGTDAAAELDAGPLLPSCHDPGHELYFGGCGCTVSACACEAACWNGTAIVCCENNPTLTQNCRCEP